MYYLIVLAFTLLAGWVIYRTASKLFRKADIADIKNKVNDTEGVYESTKDINVKTFQKQHDKIEEIKEATDL